ncbi:Crotonobetainyl-CoA reductase [subsurface metagenome]
MGRACLPGAYFSTVILGGLPILDTGSEEQKQQYLPKIASGEAIFTLALTESSASYEAATIKIKATADNNGYILNGTKLFVPNANVADYMLVVARTDEKSRDEDGITTFIVDAKSPGISYTVLKTAAKDKLCEVVFDQVRVPNENIVGQLDKGWSEVQKTQGEYSRTTRSRLERGTKNNRASGSSQMLRDGRVPSASAGHDYRLCQGKKAVWPPHWQLPNYPALLRRYGNRC